MNHFLALLRDKEGNTAIEYALVAGLVALAIIVAVTSLGTVVNTMYTDIGTEVANASL